MVETSATMIGALADGGVTSEAMRNAPSRTGALVDPDEKAPRGVGPARARDRLMCSRCLCCGDVADPPLEGEPACARRLAIGRVASCSVVKVNCSQSVLVEPAAAMNKITMAPIGRSKPLAVPSRDLDRFLRGGGEAKRRTKINSHDISRQE